MILAGYRNEMAQFLEMNPGLRSRFPIHLDFPDYSLKELMEIAELMVARRQYRLSEGAKQELLGILSRLPFGTELNGNARTVRNIIENAIRKQAVRLVKKSTKITRDELMVIEAEDIRSSTDDE